MRQAGYVLLISAALHVAGVVLSGFHAGTLILLGPALLYLLFYAGLARGMMWAAWVALIAMLIGAAGSLSEVFGTMPVPTWVFLAIFAADILAACFLFGVIWQGPRRSEAP